LVEYQLRVDVAQRIGQCVKKFFNHFPAPPSLPFCLW
jgi:hypothetical protein